MVTGIILAGGKSKRMGENKALMGLGNDTLIGHVIERVRPITNELLLITNSPNEYASMGITIHGDFVKNAGALGGIHAGLTHATHDTVLCVGCDSPFIATNLLSYLASILGEYDAVMPYTHRNSNEYSMTNHKDQRQIILQTLCASYSKNCLETIEELFNDSDYRVHALAERANVLKITPDIWQTYDAEGLSFFNINSPEDYEKAKEIYKTLHETI